MVRIILEFKEIKGEIDGKQLTGVCMDAKDITKHVRIDGEPEPTSLERALAEAAIKMLEESMKSELRAQVLPASDSCTCPKCTAEMEARVLDGAAAIAKGSLN